MCLVAEQAQTIERLETRIAEQDAEIVELQRCLAQDSSNSSKSPSSDSPFRKPPTRSQGPPSGRKPGGQAGREGCTPECVADPDKVIEYRPNRWRACERALSMDVQVKGFVRGQDFDLPDPRLTVTEHRMLKVTCLCGTTTTAPAPNGVKVPCGKATTPTPSLP
ncbi:DUF6444 domain-containing protein [Streptomyces sp. NPDC056159]|uniref:DUF6444 domain-containing protein n=1 Tax=unclassified Streptomyces TaxID=2593676 RepID=UPI003429A99F